jgi:glycosyltransferase involved in cell wall biosynthesis
LLGRLFGNALHDFDLVHLHYPFYFGGEAVHWQALRGVPYVVTYHQDVRLRGALDTVARLHHIMLGRRVLNGARLILATSLDYAVHSRLAHLPAAVRRRIVEMPNGVDTSRFTPREKVAARTEIGLPGGWISLFVGSLDSAHYFKGVAVLLQAFARFQATAVGAKPHLVIVGDGDLRPSYQALADQIGIADCVVFAGRVTDGQLSGYYAAADAVVLPSTTAGEAFGVVLLEAFASARPVIASALPGVRSVVAEGRDGFLVPPGDVVALAARLEHMAAEPGQGDAMGRAGRAKVERQYSWDVLLPQLEAYYMQALRNIERPLRARSQEGWTQ